MTTKIATPARLLLGLIYFVFGLNGFLNFIPVPETMPEGAMMFGGAMMATGYFIPVLKLTETICGLLLLFGLAAPLALVVLAPITLNILLFHAFLTPGAGNLIMPLVMIAAHGIAATAYWHLYQPLFTTGKK